MLDLLEKFQTGIVGLIGFAGVIVTLVVNARLSRRNLRETHDHDRDTLARGLLAELRSSRRSLDRNLQQLRCLDPVIHPGLNMPAHNATPVFDSSIARLGLLPNECIDPVLNAYLCLKEFDRSMVLFTRPENKRSVSRSRHGKVCQGGCVIAGEPSATR